jgi:leader peptidase (prepilin peptidase) / N-methyltransferase
MTPPLPFLLAALAVGLALGSFLNVVIYRMQSGESLVWPGSRCPHCGAPIAAYDNIPVLSWLVLRGRCRRCAAPISGRYPLVETLMGALTLALAWRWHGSGFWLAVSVIACGMLVALSFIDFDTFYIPDVLSVGLVVLGLAAAPINPWFQGSLASRFGLAFIGGLTGLGLSWAVAVAGEAAFKKEALGGGDIKLLAGVGALLGWQAVLSTLMIGSMVGSVYGIALLALGKVERQGAIPFGPFLSIGALVNLFQRLGPLDILLVPGP